MTALTRALSLEAVDPEVAEVLAVEHDRQDRGLPLLAPSMLVPEPVRQVQASALANLDGEGYPPGALEPEGTFGSYTARYAERGSARYNPAGAASEYLELLAHQRLERLFGPAGTRLFADVQPVSGSMANIAVLRALLQRGDRLVALETRSGGHLSHGAPFHLTGRDYDVRTVPLRTESTALDLDRLQDTVRSSRPKVLLIGASSFPRLIQWRDLRDIADRYGARLVADIAHFAGPVAAGLYPNPCPYADVTTFVGYKTFGGAKNGVVLTRSAELSASIRRALFPGLQGAPRLVDIASTAVAAHTAATEDFRALMRRATDLADRLDRALTARGLEHAYGGTDTHMLLLARQPGSPALVSALERIGVFANANMLPDDEGPGRATGVRFGTVGLAQRGCAPGAIEELAAILAAAIADHRAGRLDDGRSAGAVSDFVAHNLRPLTSK